MVEWLSIWGRFIIFFAFASLCRAGHAEYLAEHLSGEWELPTIKDGAYHRKATLDLGKKTVEVTVSLFSDEACARPYRTAHYLGDAEQKPLGNGNFDVGIIWKSFEWNLLGNLIKGEWDFSIKDSEPRLGTFLLRKSGHSPEQMLAKLFTERGNILTIEFEKRDTDRDPTFQEIERLELERRHVPQRLMIERNL